MLEPFRFYDSSESFLVHSMKLSSQDSVTTCDVLYFGTSPRLRNMSYYTGAVSKLYVAARALACAINVLSNQVTAAMLDTLMCK